MHLRKCRPMTLLRSNYDARATVTDEVAKKKKCRTGILLLDSGNPTDIIEAENYFIRRSLDGGSCYPLQKYLGPVFLKKKISRILNENKKPIVSSYQVYKFIHGQRLATILDNLSPETAPHLSFIGFQHTKPSVEEAMKEMELYDIERAVAIPMQPHYSCSTTGSILNRISKYNEEKREPSKIVWSAIDRWSSHPVFINSFADSIREGLDKFSKSISGNTLIIFSALPHSLRNVYMGDPYHHEVAASVEHIMEKLGNCNPHVIAWHSMVGPIPLGPDTKSVIQSLDLNSYDGALIVPISHISNGILADLEYQACLPKNVKKVLLQVESPCSRKVFARDLAELIASHLESRSSCSKNLLTKCIYCPSEHCDRMRQYFRTIQKALAISKERPLIGWSRH